LQRLALLLGAHHAHIGRHVLDGLSADRNDAIALLDACLGSSAAVLNATVFLSSLLIPQLWEAFSTVIAFRHAHRTSTFKATTALLVPEMMLIILALTFFGFFALEALKSSLSIPT